MRTDQLDFELPPELIAQFPTEQRHASRLLHYQRMGQSAAHRRFADLPSLLHPGDLLIFNDARVLPARFMLQKSTGGQVEGLFLTESALGQWQVLLKNVGSAPTGAEMRFANAPEVTVRLLEKGDAGLFRVTISPAAPAEELLDRIGRMPLPPYIRRQKGQDSHDAMDRQRYQTLFARAPGAVAAPTAALHFSEAVLGALDTRGVERAFITLHVGMGTFKPVTAARLEDHLMHVESYAIAAETAMALNRAKAEGRRIIAIGTTAARVLESQPPDVPFVEKTDQTGIFIRPPYQWKHVSALLTNFHLPRSTLIALVAAMVGLPEQRRLYQLAIAQQYRFFSYGDAMFIE